MTINNENIDEKALPNLLENFSLLREKALAYIQSTSTAHWTDHNVHDPGITILEALCYGLSDIGYRMNFPMKDILADENGNLPQNSFFYPQDILPNHAVTINDFRKLLVDLPLIKNAWISPLLNDNQAINYDYAPMFVYKKEGQLLVEKQVKELPITQTEKNEILANCKIFIIGLYAINIEFETQPILGNIDSGEAFEGVYEKDFFGDIFYDIKNWNELINNEITLRTIADAYTANSKAIAINFIYSTKNKYNNSDGQLATRILGQWYYDLEVLVNGNVTFTFKEVLFQTYFESGKGISDQNLRMLLLKNDFMFFNTCFAKIQALAKAYADIQAVLNQNRNLCEDFLPQIAAIPTIDFRICADIDVDTKVDIEQVQANIFYKIEQYISPTIPFYSFNELVAKGKAIEEILEGPKLSHGFILEDEMGENAFQNFTINLSDIINAIYETEGLINCRNVQLFLMDENGNTIPNLSNWEIKVPVGFKPILNKRKSKLIFFKNNLPLIAHFKESIIKLNLLNINSLKQTDSNVQFPSLNPTYRDLALHYSLADEFPATYKIGKNLPDNYLEKPELFTSKQLEGYLLLFEQLMANFLQDIHNLKNNLSWNTIDHLHEISKNNNWRRPYLTTGNVDAKWQNTIENPLNFLKKRNESLDFLLSRFAENLQELDNFFYQAKDNLAITETQYFNYLIEVKTNFLSNYIAISANRGAIYNLYESNSYFKTSISGYENRLANLIGAELMINGSRKKTTDIKLKIPNVNNEKDPNERGYFHVLEHIQLRVPNLTDDIELQLKVLGIGIELLSICGDSNCTACDGDDPYSFTASIVLPAYLKVYEDAHYRNYIEKLIRRETPTGVLLRICWIKEVNMAEYEQKIEAWWAAKYKLYHSNSGDYDANLIDFIKKQNEFIVTVKSQRSDYFPATLHGCEDEGEENNSRIFLDNTMLGLPKKKVPPVNPPIS